MVEVQPGSPEVKQTVSAFFAIPSPVQSQVLLFAGTHCFVALPATSLTSAQLSPVAQSEFTLQDVPQKCPLPLPASMQTPLSSPYAQSAFTLQGKQMEAPLGTQTFVPS